MREEREGIDGKDKISSLDDSPRLAKFAQLIKAAERIVFFGGAGVSTASGIPDFRSAAGLYAEQNSKHSPEYLLSHSCLVECPEDFFEFYRNKMLYPDAKPNAAHRDRASYSGRTRGKRGNRR